MSANTTPNPAVLPDSASNASSLTLVNERPPPRPIVYLVVGAAGCGKSTFLRRLVQTEASGPTHPIRLPTHPYIIASKNPKALGRSPELHFYEHKLPWSAASEAENGPFRDDVGYFSGLYDGSYDGAPDVIIVCFDIGDKGANQSVPYLTTEIQMTYPNEDIPTLLLGLKRDLRTTTADEHLFVTPSEGYGMAQMLGLKRYMECSCHTGELGKEVAEDVVDEGIKRRMIMRIEKADNDGGFFSEDVNCVVM